MTRDEQIKALEKDWATNPRWKLVKRGYSAADVVRLRGNMQIEYTLAKQGAEKLWAKVNGGAKKGYVNAFGAITAGHRKVGRKRERGRRAAAIDEDGIDVAVVKEWEMDGEGGGDAVGGVLLAVERAGNGHAGDLGDVVSDVDWRANTPPERGARTNRPP